LSNLPTEQTALAWWIDKLVAALEKEPTTALRIRQVVGEQRARVKLDDESVIVEFDSAGQLRVRADDASSQVGGEGSATRAEVCAILDARSDASQAVLSGRVAVTGPTAAVATMLHAIEILLDAATRIPALRYLADDFVAEGPRATAFPKYEGDGGVTEHEILGALDLLP
jgi:hypothetical protein